MIKRLFWLTLLGAAVTGCGTVNTVVGGEEITRRCLAEAEAYCTSIPRIYSGVSYNFCRLHAEPRFDRSLKTDGSVPIFVLDSVLSAALDTVALPYTVYRQCTDGNIQLKRP
jgi:uncharacterized protein YceK